MMDLLRYLKSTGRNFGQVAPLLYRGSLPDEKEYRRLKDLGIALVINLIGGDDHLETDAREKAMAAGLHWRWFPMRDDEAPDTGQLDECLGAIRDSVLAKEPVFFGCKGNRHRGSLVAACYLVRYQGYSKEQAWKEQAKPYGYYDRLLWGKDHSPIRRFFFERFTP